MPTPYEQISEAYASRDMQKTDANLAQDSLQLGGIDAENYATKEYARRLVNNKSASDREYADQVAATAEANSKGYTDKEIELLSGQVADGYTPKSDTRTINQNLNTLARRVTTDEGAITANADQIERNKNAIKDLADELDGVESNIRDININITALEAEVDAIDLTASKVKLNNPNFTSKNVNAGMTELFQSVSSGKRQVAAAITDKGVNTASDATFSQMAENIGEISTMAAETNDANAIASDIKKNKTAYVKGQKIVGTAEGGGGGGTDTSDATATSADLMQGKTAYARGIKLTGIAEVVCPEMPNVRNTGDATAVAGDIKQGKTAYVKGVKVVGILENTGGIDTEDATASASDIASGKTAYARGQKIVGIASQNGVDTNDATAMSSDILYGKTAYVRGAKVTGSAKFSGGDLDTSDATASAEDIMFGKTAYVNGRKIYGTNTGTDSGAVIPGVIPDTTLPKYGNAELIYASKPGIARIGSSEITISSNYTIYDIAYNKLMLAYDSTDQKFKFLIIENSPLYGDIYVQNVGRSGSTEWLITPEYTYSDLGIASTDTILEIKINKDATKIAIRTKDTSNYIKAYVFGFNANNYNEGGFSKTGKIITEVETILGVIKYNKFIIETQETLDNGNMCWTTASDKLLIQVGWPRNARLYEFDAYVPDDNLSGYGKVYCINDSISWGNGSSAGFGTERVTAQFINNDKILVSSARYNRWEYQYNNHIFVFDDNFNVVNSQRTATYVLTDDAKHAINGDKLYSVNIDYVANNGITFTQIGTLASSVGECKLSTAQFAQDNAFLYANGNIYYIDFDNCTSQLLDNNTFSSFKTIYNNKIMLLQKGSKYVYVTIEEDQGEVIGVIFDGVPYYKNAYESGVLTAVPSDVPAGKTFIGYLGVPQTGTKIVGGE